MQNKRLMHLYKKNTDLIYKAIVEYLRDHPKAGKKEVHGALTKNRGINPDTHNSGKPPGGLKEGHNKTQRDKTPRFYRIEK